MRFQTALPVLLSALVLAACSTTRHMTALKDLERRPLHVPLTDTLLARLLESRPDYFAEAVRNKDAWRIQIIYSQIDRTADNVPRLTHHYFNLDPARYFYPASTVKMPAAALALQRLNELAVPGLDRNSTMITGADGPGQTPAERDSTSASGLPSVAQYIRKIFLVSDNDAYNRLYEFLGQDYLNGTLHRMGYDSVQLLHRLQLPLTEEQNRLTNPITFLDTQGQPLYRQPAQKSTLSFPPRTTRLGTAYLSGGKRVDEPFDFSRKNRITLPELHTILQSIVLPASVPARQRFQLTEDDYRFLYRSMSMLPRESVYPKYDSSYPDGYVKFLLLGGSGSVQNPSLRILNKVGDAYGFLQDVAYIVDFESGVEFLLSATIYCNNDGIFNDDRYDYDTVGFPFLKHLGEVIYGYEKSRRRSVKPDLSRYRISDAH